MEIPVISQPSQHLRVATSAFITFLYAAAVHIVLHAGHLHGLHARLTSSLTLLVIVVFFLTDWLSRTRLPSLVNDPVNIIPQIIKTILDLTCLYFLLFTALAFVDVFHQPAAAGATKIFFYYLAAFSMFTFVWNLQMFWIMDHLKYWELARATLTGNTLQLKATRIYGKRYLDFRDRIVESNKTQQISVLRPLGGSAAIVIGDLIPQFVALHLSVGNIFLFLAAACHGLKGGTAPILAYLYPRSATLASVIAKGLQQQPWLFILGATAVVANASIQYVRRGSYRLFWLWLVGGGAFFFVFKTIFWPLALTVVVATAAALVPALFYWFSSDRIEWGFGPTFQKVLRRIGSCFLLLEYVFLLMIVPPMVIPVIAVVQHFAINFILQYAATPVGEILDEPPFRF